MNIFRSIIKKSDWEELIHKQAQISSELDFYIRSIEQGRKENISIEDFLNAVIEIKELTEKLSLLGHEPTFLFNLREVNIKNGKYQCREKFDKNKKCTFY
ncbi:hypothetical protein AMS64_02985 [Aeromonas veronii]|uniref:hypothetical protein n=1 Tax=Aeromonas veronii TaxID=654 RepID=UPI00078C38CF|nr:hypothetical protein [Aeromonas veronii]AMQ41430.1 hypothetical protein AMS64_02985 [Aeromonas veronii]MBL0488917.1 hypothetical protein [Aeromonas veronii]MCX0426157.1 hypothetical protein [Aeromonas veronii]POG17851.1 hypothetical protein C2849_16685 [Aeromonas veronii]